MKNLARPRLTLATVNRFLAQHGIRERLTRGEGYFYFADGDSHRWPTTIVGGVYRLNALTLEQWLFEHANLSHNSPNTGDDQ